MKSLSIVALITILSCLAVLCASADSKPKSFTLWQLPEQTDTQMMSYVMRTSHGKVIVIDGGNKGDTEYLRKFLLGIGGKVDAWFLSHPHDDHWDAPIGIMSKPQGIEIGRIYASLPDDEWMAKLEPGNVHTLRELREVLQSTGRTAIELPLGAHLIIDNVNFEVLGVKNPEIHAGAVNNSSLVFRVWDSVKSVLFTGDIETDAGNKLLNGPYASKLRSDYCQMSHHGQTGANEAFYKAVSPKFCLWTTPKWLWENDNGGGKGSGPWTTLDTRKWADELGVKRSYVTCIDGLVRID